MHKTRRHELNVSLKFLSGKNDKFKNFENNIYIYPNIKFQDVLLIKTWLLIKLL